MTLRLFFSLLALSSFLFSCSHVAQHYEQFGADEFVIDSYTIHEGKFSILEMEGVEVGELPEGAMDEYDETITDGDILSIAVYHPKRKDLMKAVELINANVGFRVNEGKINLPDIEPVNIDGLSIEAARSKLQDRYAEEISDVDVFISYRDRLVRRVELTGMVKVPNIPVDGKMRLFELLSLAGVPTTANLFRSYVVRDGELLRVDLNRLVRKGDMSHNIVMHGGDKVFIASAEASNVMLMGEVGKPQAVPVPRGYISLREAIVLAGGIPFGGDRNHIQVLRGNLVRPKVYRLSWDHIINLPNKSLLLMPGDVVYVSTKPLTEWNRFINSVLPSLGGMTSAYGVYKNVR